MTNIKCIEYFILATKTEKKTNKQKKSVRDYDTTQKCISHFEQKGEREKSTRMGISVAKNFDRNYKIYVCFGVQTM